jgi:2-haloacid dehalogenase
MTRRDFITDVAAGIAMAAATTTTTTSATLALAQTTGPVRDPSTTPKVRAVAFDAFALFDPRPIAALVEQLFPGRGSELTREWRSRQFEYTWLRALSGSYVDFWQVTSDALAFAGKRLKIEIAPEQRDRLMNAHLELNAWPDVPPALDALKQMGCRLAILSNFTPTMLKRCITSAGLEGRFEHVLSSDQRRTYKPDPRAYQLGIDAMNLARAEVLFVAFAGWDAAGAKSFGYPTYWANRLKLPAEELGATANEMADDCSRLVKFLDG